MIIGFTGTRQGMTYGQRQVMLGILFDRHTATEFHHGDAIGSDAEAHSIARSFGLRIVIHPPSDPRQRARCVGDQCMSELGFLVRNRRIVHACDLLIAMPRFDFEEVRSGTWSTVRHAAKVGRETIVILPNGRTVCPAMRELCPLGSQPPEAMHTDNSDAPE